MISYHPKKIYIDKEVQDSSITRNILNYFPTIEHEYIEGKPSFLDYTAQYSDPLLEGKKHLWITKNKGKLMKKCGAATSRNNSFVCCNYFILDFSFNCHFECVYCFLQEYTNMPLMVVYANVEDMLEEVDNLIHTTSSPQIRIGTGEVADSLALDQITGFSKYLVPFFAKQKKALLELKTKSNQVDNLLTMDPKGQTVVAWSLNPPKVIEKYEFKTASLEERLEAAKRCEKVGYQIAFHLDPLIAEPNWREEYKGLIERIFLEFKPVWLSLGALRFNANLKSIIQKRFPKTELTTGEFVTTEEGKKRYVRFFREEMYKTLHQMILAHSPKTPVYLCMETGWVWQNVMGYLPKTEQDLEKHIIAN